MSLEFSQEFDTAPIISPSYVPQDAGETGLRPKLLSDYTGLTSSTEVRSTSPPWSTPESPWKSSPRSWQTEDCGPRGS